MRFVAKICILPALFLSSFAAPLGQIYPDELTKRKHFEHKDASTKDSTLESLILQSQTSSTFDRTSSTTEGPFTAISRTSMNLEPMPVTKSAATQEPSTAISSASLNFEPPPVTKSAATQALTTDVFDSFSTVTFSTDVSTQTALASNSQLAPSTPSGVFHVGGVIQADDRSWGGPIWGGCIIA